MTKDASSSSTNTLTTQNKFENESRQANIEMEGGVAESRKPGRRNVDTVALGKTEAEDGKAGERRTKMKGEVHKNKQSWDYIWRTGLAGGLAGSAVCIPPMILFLRLLRTSVECLITSESLGE